MVMMMMMAMSIEAAKTESTFPAGAIITHLPSTDGQWQHRFCLVHHESLCLW